MQINKGKIVDHDYKVGDKVMLTNNASFKYETQYNGPFLIMQCWNNGTVTLRCGATKIKHNIININPYTCDKNDEDIKNKITYDDVNI